MLHRSLFRDLLPSLIVFLSIAAAAKAQEYKVVLSRPETLGRVYTISADGSFRQTSTFTIQGKAPQRQEKIFAVQIEGSIKDLEIDRKSHQATKLELTVKKCLRDEKPFFDPGTIVLAEDKGGNTAFSVNGTPVAPDDAIALGLVINTYHSGEPTDGEMFGTDQPQKVGGSWPINADAAVSGARKNGVPVTRDQIKGESKLVSVKNIDGVEALEVEATMEVPQFSGLLGNGPKVELGSVVAHFGGIFPNDAISLPLQTSQSTRMHITGTVTGPHNQTASLDGDLERSNTVKYSRSTK
jgi:hypothetical protein